jgi:hypothetical protein
MEDMPTWQALRDIRLRYPLTVEWSLTDWAWAVVFNRICRQEPVRHCVVPWNQATLLSIDCSRQLHTIDAMQQTGQTQQSAERTRRCTGVVVMCLKLDSALLQMVLNIEQHTPGAEANIREEEEVCHAPLHTKAPQQCNPMAQDYHAFDGSLQQ